MFGELVVVVRISEFQIHDVTCNVLLREQIQKELLLISLISLEIMKFWSYGFEIIKHYKRLRTKFEIEQYYFTRKYLSRLVLENGILMYPVALSHLGCLRYIRFYVIKVTQFTRMVHFVILNRDVRHIFTLADEFILSVCPTVQQMSFVSRSFNSVTCNVLFRQFFREQIQNEFLLISLVRFEVMELYISSHIQIGKQFYPISFLCLYSVHVMYTKVLHRSDSNLYVM